MRLEQMLDPMARPFNDYGMVIGDVHRVAAKYVRMVIVQKAMNLTFWGESHPVYDSGGRNA